MEELFDSLRRLDILQIFVEDNSGSSATGSCTAAACTRRRGIRILNFCRRRCAQGRWGVHLNVRIH